MAGLSDVVVELQQQNRTLDDVKDSIKGMLLANEASRKAAERQTGDKEEARREEKTKTKAVTNRSAPKSFSQGFGQGSGFSDLKSMIPSFMGGAGLLGGATIGGLLGGAAGRLFFPAIGAFFGAKYADKWVKPLTDKIFGDDATFEVFGKDVDASKIAGGVGGALAIMFSGPAITQVAKGMLGVGDDTKTGKFRKTLVRKFGLGALAMSLAGTVGDYIETQTGSVDAGNITEHLINGAGLAAMFVPGGFLLKAMATFAIAGAGFIKDYMEEQAKLRREQFQAEVDDMTKSENLSKMSDNVLIEKANNMASDASAGFINGRGVTNYDATKHEAYLQELERRNPEEAALVLLREDIQTQLAQMRNAAPMNKSSFTGPLQAVLDEYKALAGADHPAQAELRAFQDRVKPTAATTQFDQVGMNTAGDVNGGGLSLKPLRGDFGSWWSGKKTDDYNFKRALQKYNTQINDLMPPASLGNGGNGSGGNVDASVSTSNTYVNKSDRIVNQASPSASDLLDMRYNRTDPNWMTF
tara:strand:+ start:70 stop:1647 length:1578 start_codon:yes stop_codon:yes gene_type:complete